VSILDDVAAIAAAAKDAYRLDPTPAGKARYKEAAGELRYQRWVARGGPTQEPTEATAGYLDRFNVENAKG
jgi:hypothetical protein